MSNVALYDPNSTVVANRVTSYLLSVNTPDYTSNPDALINPDVSGLSGISSKYWVYDGTNIVEMGASDKTAVDNFLIAKTILDKNILVSTYTRSKRLSTETWYATDNGDETYSDKVEESTYTYQGNDLISKEVVTYYADGSTQSTITHNYFMNSDDEAIVKKERP